MCNLFHVYLFSEIPLVSATSSRWHKVLAQTLTKAWTIFWARSICWSRYALASFTSRFSASGRRWSLRIMTDWEGFPITGLFNCSSVTGKSPTCLLAADRFFHAASCRSISVPSAIYGKWAWNRPVVARRLGAQCSKSILNAHKTQINSFI